MHAQRVCPRDPCGLMVGGDGDRMGLSRTKMARGEGGKIKKVEGGRERAVKVRSKRWDQWIHMGLDVPCRA